MADDIVKRLRAHVTRPSYVDDDGSGLCAEAADEIERLRQLNGQAGMMILALRAALDWYAEQTRLCRLIHREGDAGRNALATDGGERACAALAGSAPAPATTTTYTVPGPYAPIQTSGYSQPDWPTMRPVAPASAPPAEWFVGRSNTMDPEMIDALKTPAANYCRHCDSMLTDPCDDQRADSCPNRSAVRASASPNKCPDCGCVLGWHDFDCPRNPNLRNAVQPGDSHG